MKKRNFIFVGLLLVANLQANDNEIKKEGIGYIKMLGSELKSNLVSKMKADPTGEMALGFCIGAAKSITEDVNKKLPTYASVRRTALKYRTQDSKPDAVDEKIMSFYIEKIANKTFSPKDIVMVKNDNIYRVYKPLLTQKICLKCHGRDIKKELKVAINKAYPKDLATDFNEGDFRGVIVAEIKK